uniref:Secreted protein n=1 Tax=Ascaris lumbricoides TaxID=6252 RepID=A0A0M3HP23_ASCLU
IQGDNFDSAHYVALFTFTYTRNIWRHPEVASFSRRQTSCKMLSAPMNAFVYIAFSSRLQRYIRLQVRRASESLIISNDSYRSDHTMATICNKSLYACRKHVTSI